MSEESKTRDEQKELFGDYRTKEQKEVTSDQEKMLAMAKDLVELAIQSQKVLAASSISYSAIEEARLLAIMTNAVIDQYTEESSES